MLFNASLLPLTVIGVVLFVVLIIWEAVWKGIGMWRAGRNNHIVWFICIMIFNTVGILPIVYLLWFQNKSTKVKKRR